MLGKLYRYGITSLTHPKDRWDGNGFGYEYGYGLWNGSGFGDGIGGCGNGNGCGDMGCVEFPGGRIAWNPGTASLEAVAASDVAWIAGEEDLAEELLHRSPS